MPLSVLLAVSSDAVAPETILAGSLVSVVVGAAYYVWVALATSRIFVKLGEPSWKAWVPVVNPMTVLRIGGYSALWVIPLLLPFVPFVGLAGAVVFYVAVHSINRQFDRGAGFTVLAVLLFPVWASILGFGSVRPKGELPADAAAVLASTPFESRMAGLTRAGLASGGVARGGVTSDGVTEPIPTGAPESTLAGTNAQTSAIVAGATSSSVVPDSNHPAPFPSPSGQPFPEVTPFTIPNELPEPDLFPEPDPFPEPGRWPLPSPPAEPAAPVAPVPLPEFGAGPVEATAPTSAGNGFDTAPRFDPDSETADEPEPDIDPTIVKRRGPKWALLTRTGKIIPMTADLVLVGRNPSASGTDIGAQLVAIADPTKMMSKTHARLELVYGQWMITDLDSTNGTILVEAAGEELELEPRVPTSVRGAVKLGQLEITLQQED